MSSDSGINSLTLTLAMTAAALLGPSFVPLCSCAVRVLYLLRLCLETFRYTVSSWSTSHLRVEVTHVGGDGDVSLAVERTVEPGGMHLPDQRDLLQLLLGELHETG